MSTDETLDFIRAAAIADGGAYADTLVEALDSLGDDADARQAAAEGIAESVCGEEDDDTTLRETTLYQ